MLITGNANSVEFSTPSGDRVRYTVGKGCLRQEIVDRGQWRDVGVAAELWYDPATRALVDGKGSGGVLPREVAAEIVERLAELGDKAGITHNMSPTPPLSPPKTVYMRELEVTFTAPNGDGIKYVPSTAGLKEYMYDRAAGVWRKVGTAMSLNYDRTTRGLVDHCGSGGCLPEEGLQELLSALRKAAEASGIPHNIPRNSRTRRRSRSRSRSSRSGSTLSGDSRAPDPPRYPSPGYWTSFIEEIVAVDRALRKDARR